ncbi:ABC transporter ATP-binding protein [Malaciobacter molluscorum LMG 25693]|uniref:ABC transporter ATP-binding protein n=1 Tax=Malaciobacter molluscorum LMG 25693 TaxID=870501 RepID=A0A2G1DKT9_9BACT|nr:ABC transporter ATP-binding protein [Malaciobacter molluscorum]AXX92600.1 ABC transporter, ATP-binding/permease components [Malaciobacter molluscorum LMG 25693]PHO19024.1 ABC transporter ATP-binding protein [Malaciobacter molluscorum LMG 25693]
MSKKITIKYIWNLLLHKKKQLILGQFVTIIAILISVPIPLMLPALVDEVLLNKPDFFVNNINNFFGSGNAFYYVVIVTLCVIFLRFLHFLFTAITTKIFTAIAKYITFKIREKLLNHLKIVSMNEYETLGSGSISANLITDVNTLDGFIITGASKLVSSTLTLLAVSFVLIAIHPVLGLMILIIQPIIIFLSKKIARSVGSLKKEENNAIGNFQENVGEVLELFGQIKASNKENDFFNESIKKAKNVKDTSNEFSYKSIAYERFSFTIFLASFEILRASGLLMVAYSDLSIGMMFAMFGYIWFIMTPVQDILSLQYSYAQARTALERINKILELQTENSGNKKIEEEYLNIELKNLYFKYNEDKDILKDISLKINFKDKVALIGASGSGKTTLAQIISSFYNKYEGELLFNNKKIENIKKESIRDSIFLVLQMPILFNNTLRFNITMGNDNIKDKDIFNALKIAQLEDTVLKMPQKLDTIVGRHGIRLSGGQRQRLSIARMIIANPKVVIFDESTSALDVHTEVKLFEALEPILKDKTVITIAHRLSTVKNAHKIYVLNDGKLVQEGTHKQLEQEEGHYQDFVKNQLI